VRLLTPDERTIVDEYGEIRRKIAEFKPVPDRGTVLAGIIQGWFADLPAAEGSIADGYRYQVHISPREKQRSILDIAKLYRLFGVKRFLQLVKIPLEVLEKELPAADHGKYIGEAKTGKRRLTPVIKSIPFAIGAEQEARKAA
jgi:hypothetical protein